MKRTKRKESIGYRVFTLLNTLFMILFSLSFILPLFMVLSSSFLGSAERNLRGSYVLVPRMPELTAYKILLSEGSNVLLAYRNTLTVLVVGTALSLIVTSMLAYGLTKKTMPGRNLFTTLIFITMIFSGGMIPTYLLVDSLGLMDTLWALILPGLVSAWNVFLMRNFFSSIPESLEESAVLDGATPFTVFLKIVLPLSKAVLAVIGMFYAVGYWNSWFPGVMYINDPKLLPMQNVMRNVISLYSASDINAQMMNDLQFLDKPPMESLQMATIVVGTLPILLVYPFIQKYFVKGVMVGSIKG